MRIAYLVPELSHRNGWAHYSLEVAQAVRRAGADIIIISPVDSPEVEEFQQYRLLPPADYFGGSRLLWMMQALPSIWRCTRDCDVIHSTIEWYALLGKLLAGKRPSALTIHGSYVHVDEWARFPINHAIRLAYRHSNLISVSDYTATVIREVFPKSQPIVIPHGVDSSIFDTTTEATKSGNLLLTAGGVKARKGTLHLIRALPKIRQQIPDVKCVILGKRDVEPAYWQQVQAEIQQLDVADCVRLLGFVSEEEKLEWYRKADVFVMAGVNAGWKFEGFGLVYLEAGAAKLPVIGTTNNGAEDAIQHEVTGLLIDQADIDGQLADAILRILQNPEQAKAMGEAGYRQAKAMTWDKVGEQLIRVYRNLIG